MSNYLLYADLFLYLKYNALHKNKNIFYALNKNE